MKIFLIGNTGFVGSNLSKQYQFDGLYNSKNVKEAYGKNPNVIVYSAVPAQKFLANSNPSQDEEVIKTAISNIKQINPEKIILISTIDVYENPFNVDEDSNQFQTKEAYGKDRHNLEVWVQENFQNYLIVRLPALYGDNIKKNFIYDLINIIPSMLKEEKFNELSKLCNELNKYYTLLDNGFYKLNDITSTEKEVLKTIFKNLNFTALNFTDSRAKFQFYNLANLWKDINIALDNNLRIVNLATEPIEVRELYRYIYNEDFENEVSSNIPNYNYKTKYYEMYNGKDGYIYNKKEVMEDIKNFVKKKVN